MDMSSEESQESNEEEKIPEISSTTAVMHLVKSYIGTGLLSIPWAMMHTGIALGPILLAVLGVISFHAMHVLVKCSKHFCRAEQVRSVSYSTLMMHTMRINPIKWVQQHAKTGKTIVDALLITLQLGICSVLLVFIGQNIRQVVSEVWLDEPSDRVFIVMVFIPLMFLSFIKSLKIFAWFSFTANFTTLISIILLFWYISKDLPAPQTRPLVVEPSTIPLFVGSALYSFEGISMVLPIENEMKNPEKFDCVLNTSAFIVCSCYLITGFVGFLKFGFATCGSITLNILPICSIWAKTIKFLFAFSVFVNWLLQFYVVLQILFPFFEEAKWRQWKEALLRIALASFTCTCAVVVPDLGGFMSLVGAFVTSILGIVLPALIELMIEFSPPQGAQEPLLQEHHTFHLRIVIKDLLMIVLGTLACVIGTAEAINVIIIHLSTKEESGICSGGKTISNITSFVHHV